ncbi:hypothetical protein [Neolewinella agarilytica]|nr:hypothetical protein [Neolewinella agarilytica]
MRSPTSAAGGTGHRWISDATIFQRYNYSDMAFWDNIADLFRQAEESTPAKPAIHELIVRSPEEIADFERWKRTHNSRRLLDWLNQQFTFHLEGLPIDKGLGFLDTDSSRGFVIYLQELNYSKADIVHFFDFLKERIQSLNYRSDISDRRLFSRKDWVETQERHYLKPRIKLDENPIQQQFGNITIQLEIRDDLVHNLRLRATVYNDSMYEEAASFRALMVALEGND